MLCNEEAKLIGLEGNRYFGDDIIAGVFYVTGDRNGQLDSLPDAYMEKYTKLLYEPEDISTEEVEESISFELCFIDDNKDGDNEWYISLSILPILINNDTVRDLIEGYLTTYDSLYGEDRNVDEDDGGYVLYCDPGTSAVELKSFIDYEDLLCEYTSTMRLNLDT